MSEFLLSGFLLCLSFFHFHVNKDGAEEKVGESQKEGFLYVS